jgi:tRNA G18 (ribose-2'-O)-methylase SpoU
MTVKPVPDNAKQRWAAARRQARRQQRRDQYRQGLRPIAIAAWEISKEYNVGSLVRTAHAAAVSEVMLIGEREWNVEAARTAEDFTTVVRLDSGEELLARVNDRGWSLVAVELHHRAVSLFEAEYPERPCFLLGAELGGIPEQLLDACETIVQIPQWGLVPSLNLAVAGSIVLYDYLSKCHRDGILDRPQGGLD